MIEAAYRQYERRIPQRIRRWLVPIISSPATLRQFVVYVLIGVAVTGLDFGLLALLLYAGLYRPLSVSIAFLTACTAQFFLNKYCNFRNFDRTTSAQAGTYVALTVTFWLATVLWIEIMVRAFELPPLLAKLSFIPVNVVGGFLSVRYLAFGKGIRRTIVDALKARRTNK